MPAGSLRWAFQPQPCTLSVLTGNGNLRAGAKQKVASDHGAEV